MHQVARHYYEIVSKGMRDQGLHGDPKEFILGYYKELNTVTTLSLKPVSPEVVTCTSGPRSWLLVRLKMLLEVKKDNRRKPGVTRTTGVPSSSMVKSGSDRLSGRSNVSSTGSDIST